MKPNKLEQKIYKVLMRDTENCQFKTILTKAISPLIIINPKIKAKEIFREICIEKK